MDIASVGEEISNYDTPRRLIKSSKGTLCNFEHPHTPVLYKKHHTQTNTQSAKEISVHSFRKSLFIVESKSWAENPIEGSR